jgi:hypothetical protein
MEGSKGGFLPRLDGEVEEGRMRGRRGERPAAALDVGQRRVREVGKGADERARAVSDWSKKKKGGAVDGGSRRLTGRKRELGHAVITGRMREGPARSWAAGWKREGEREGWGLGFFSYYFFKLSKV